MKKVLFYRTRRAKNGGVEFEPDTGYQHYFGTSEGVTISVVFAKRPFSWDITEEKTGVLIKNGFSTRKEAVDWFDHEKITLVYNQVQQLMSLPKNLAQQLTAYRLKRDRTV